MPRPQDSPPRSPGAAADFLRAWTDHTGIAAELSGQQTDALRSVLGAWLRTDAEAAARVRALAAYLGERP